MCWSLSLILCSLVALVCLNSCVKTTLQWLVRTTKVQAQEVTMHLRYISCSITNASLLVDLRRSCRAGRSNTAGLQTHHHLVEVTMTADVQLA